MPVERIVEKLASIFVRLRCGHASARAPPARCRGSLVREPLYRVSGRCQRSGDPTSQCSA